MNRGRRGSIPNLSIRLTRHSVPVIIAFTKFDQVVAIEGGSLGSARTNARARFEQSCYSLFHKEPRAVPAVIVSGSCSFSSFAKVLFR